MSAVPEAWKCRGESDLEILGVVQSVPTHCWSPHGSILTQRNDAKSSVAGCSCCSKNLVTPPAMDHPTSRSTLHFCEPQSARHRPFAFTSVHHVHPEIAQGHETWQRHCANRACTAPTVRAKPFPIPLEHPVHKTLRPQHHTIGQVTDP